MSRAVKWAWRHFALEADVYDTLDEAIESAVFAADAGAEALDCIEHEGERITFDHPRFEAVCERIRKEEEAALKSRRSVTHRVEARHPDGKWVVLYVVSMPLTDSIAEEMKEFASALGEDRVRLVQT